jgi:hypothetical protein
VVDPWCVRMENALLGRTIDPWFPGMDRGPGGIEMNHEETIALAQHHRDQLLSDAHQVHAGHRVRRTGRPSLRVWRRSRPASAA